MDNVVNTFVPRGGWHLGNCVKYSIGCVFLWCPRCQHTLQSRTSTIGCLLGPIDWLLQKTVRVKHRLLVKKPPKLSPTSHPEHCKIEETLGTLSHISWYWLKTLFPSPNDTIYNNANMINTFAHRALKYGVWKRLSPFYFSLSPKRLDLKVQ